jgi:hypothetical protein
MEASTGHSPRTIWILLGVGVALSLSTLPSYIQTIFSGDTSPSSLGIPAIDLAYAGLASLLLSVVSSNSSGRNIAYAFHDRALVSRLHLARPGSLLDSGLRLFLGIPLTILATALSLNVLVGVALSDLKSFGMDAAAGLQVASVLGTVGGVVVTIAAYVIFRRRVGSKSPDAPVTSWGRRIFQVASIARSGTNVFEGAIQFGEQATAQAVYGAVRIGHAGVGFAAAATQAASRVISGPPPPHQSDQRPYFPSPPNVRATIYGSPPIVAPPPSSVGPPSCPRCGGQLWFNGIQRWCGYCRAWV